MMTFERFEIRAISWACCGCHEWIEKGRMAVRAITENAICYCSYKCLAVSYTCHSLTQTPAEIKALFWPDLIEELKHNEDVKFKDLSKEKQGVFKKAGRRNVLWLSSFSSNWTEIDQTKESYYFDCNIYKLKPDYYPEGSIVSEIPTPILKGSIMYHAFIGQKDEKGKVVAHVTEPELIIAETASEVVREMTLNHSNHLEDDNNCVVAVSMDYTVLA